MSGDVNVHRSPSEADVRSRLPMTTRWRVETTRTFLRRFLQASHPDLDFLCDLLVQLCSITKGPNGSNAVGVGNAQGRTRKTCREASIGQMW